MNKHLTFWNVAGFALLYFAAVFAAEFIGFIHPVCWVLAPAVGALLAAAPYRWLSVRWTKFGLGTTLSAVLALLLTVLGEMDIARMALCVGFGLLSDIVRLAVKRDCVTYPVLALGNIANIVYLWTRKAWYLEGAAEECGQAYADAMVPLQNGIWLAIAAGAIVVLAETGLWVAKKIIKNNEVII